MKRSCDKGSFRPTENVSPAFQIYPGDFLRDPDFLVLCPAARGMQFTLMFFAWRYAPPCLRDNDDFLKSLLGNPPEWTPAIALQVKSLWKSENGYLFYEPLTKQYEQQKKNREQRSLGARITNSKRWPGDRPAIGERSGSGRFSSSSSSSLSSSSSISISDAPSGEGKKPIPKGQAMSPPRQAPVEEILKLFHEKCREFPKVKKLTADRKKHLQNRWTEHPDLSFWGKFFQRVASSDFLRGEGYSFDDDRPPFKGDFGWIIKEENFVKILEGKYDNPT